MSSKINPSNADIPTSGDRSAAEIERDVEQTRARLTGTVEQLKDRVSPGTLAEEAMDWLRGSGGKEFLGNLGGTLRDNPVPVVLIAAGIGWLALGGRGGSAGRWPEDRGYPAAGRGRRDYPRSYAGESYPPETYAGQAGSGIGASAGGLKDRASELGHQAGDAAAGLRDRAGELVGRAGDTAAGAWDSATGAARSVAEGARSAGQRVADGAGQAWHSAADTASGLGEDAYRLGNRTSRRIAEAVESQPLVLGAFGLALGAAVGALLPASEAEDRLMGESRDRVANRLSTLAGDALDRAKEVAGEAGDNLGEAYGRVRERVGSAGGGTDALGEVARDLRETVERTAQDVAGAAREATGRPAPDAPGRQQPPGSTPV